MTVFDGRRGYGEVGHKGGAVGVDFSPREAELRVIGVKCDPKFFRLRWLCGSEGRGGVCGVVGEWSFLERLLLGLALALILDFCGLIAPT